MVMEITNEEKIALLKFLGYHKYAPNELQYSHLWCKLNIKDENDYATAIKFDEFNPLDISILTKAFDIISSKGVNYSIHHNSGLVDRKYEIAMQGLQYNQYGTTINEAILKAVLEYIKTNKQ